MRATYQPTGGDEVTIYANDDKGIVGVIVWTGGTCPQCDRRNVKVRGDGSYYINGVLTVNAHCVACGEVVGRLRERDKET